MTAPGKYMSQLAVREQGWDSVISEEMYAWRVVKQRRDRVHPFDYKDIYVGKGDRQAGAPRFCQLMGQTSNLQRTAAIASTRRTHVVSVVAVIAA